MSIPVSQFIPLLVLNGNPSLPNFQIFFLCFIFTPLFPGNRNRVVILVSSSPFKRLQLWRQQQQQVALPWRLYCMAAAAAAAARISGTMPRQVQVSRPFPCTFPF